MLKLKKELEDTFKLPFEIISETELLLKSEDSNYDLSIFVNENGFNILYKNKLKSEYRIDKFINLLKKNIKEIKKKKYVYKVFNKEKMIWEDFSGMYEKKEDAIDWYERKGENWEQKGFKLKLSTTYKEVEK